MKTDKFYTLITAIILAISCKKENNTNNNYKQQISLRANGNLFSVTSGDAGVTQSDAHINSSKFQLDATTSTKDFSINKQNVSALGSYIIDAGTTGVFNFAQWEDGSSLYSSIGSSKSHLLFTISRKVETSSDYFLVEGTFSGVLYNVTQTDSVRITEGQFRIL